jgi:Glycosyltransferase family 87
MVSVNSQARATGAPRRKLYLAVLLWAIAAVCAVALCRELPFATKAGFRDFDTYYSPAYLLRQGRNPYAVNSVWGDTPSWFLCFEPLTLFARFTAYKLWFLINVLALTIALIALLRDSALEQTDKWILAALIVLYPPIACNFWFGQSEIIVLLLLVLFIRELQRGRDLAAGMILAAASLLRAYPVGLIGYLAACRKWKAVVYTVLGCIAGMTITTVFVGSDVVTTYIQNVIGPHPLNQPIGFLRHPANLSLFWFVRFVLLHGFGISERSPVSSSLALIVGLIAAAFAFAATWRLDEDSDWRGFSLWVVTVSILSPIMWGQFMVCFAIVFVAIAKGPASSRTVVAAVASYVMLVAFGDMHGYPLNILPEFAQSYFGRNIRVLHVLPESVPVSLILLYLACWWFVSDAKPRPSSRTGGMLTSHIDASQRTAF